MESTPREAAQTLLQLRNGQRLAARYSSNNGVILLAWAAVHLLDMLVFEAGLIVHSILAAVVGVIVINGLLLLWLIWYRRRLPIQPLRALTRRVIFLWSWYYVVLIGAGVGGWAVFIGPFPAGWFIFLGVFGALPLAVCGYRLHQQARA